MSQMPAPTSLKTDLNTILSNYNVPMDDRSLIFEKIDSYVLGLIENEKKSLIDQAAAVGEKMKAMKAMADSLQAMGKEGEAKKSELDEAYQEGLDDGLAQVVSSTPNTYLILGGVFIAALLLVVVAGKATAGKER